MEFSRTERLILANQYRILAMIEPDQSESHQQAIRILERGYEREYDKLVQNIFDGSDKMTEDECTEVHDILAMFQFLHEAYYEDLSEKPEIDERQIKFIGFGSMEEIRYGDYAQYVCKDRMFYSSIPRDNFDIGVPMLPRYRRQLKAWKDSANPNKLTAEDVKRIAQAAEQ